MKNVYTIYLHWTIARVAHIYIKYIQIYTQSRGSVRERG